MPDSAVVFQTTDGARPFLDNSSKLMGVFFPVSPTRLLIGETKRNALTQRRLRNTLAECSVDGFAAQINSTKFIKFQRRIGKTAHVIDPKELERVVDMVFCEFLDNGPL